MGSTLLRDKREIKEDGSSRFDYETPTLSIGGTKDGLMRVTRIAETYWHTIKNIHTKQEGMFPVVVLEGVAHHSFMSPPTSSYVESHDLAADVADKDAHVMITQQMVEFIHSVLIPSYKMQSTNTADILSPFIEAMELEGNYNLKEPCYNASLVNDHSLQCTHGSLWNSQKAQNTMAGDLAGVQIHSDNNFHRVYTVTPVHLAQFNNTCNKGDKKCVIESITVTEAFYDKMDSMDTGEYPIAAQELKTKMMSRQASQIAAGFVDPQFNVTDEIGNRCAEIN